MRIVHQHFGAICIVIIFASPMLKGCSENQTSVESSRLGSEIKVIGRLGQPLGKMIKIEGEMVKQDFVRSKSMEGVPLFWAKAVNGKNLKEPVLVELQFFSFQSTPNLDAGHHHVFEGYEDGGFRGIPDEAFRRMLPVATVVWSFHVQFQVVISEAGNM